MINNQSMVSPIRRQYRQYSRDSFDRFGDDLSELIFSYLRLEDKLRLECVSKQWHRLVFTKQLFVSDNVLSGWLSDYWTKDRNKRPVMARLLHWFGRRYNGSKSAEQFKSLLHKCPNVRAIELKKPLIDDSLLLAISQSCARLESIEFNVCGLSVEAILSCSQTICPRLKSIAFRSNDIIEKSQTNENLFLDYCSNVKSLVCNDFLSLDFADQQFLPHLERLSKVSLKSSLSSNLLAFDRMVDKYENKLRQIDIEINVVRNATTDAINALQQLSRLKNLEIIALQVYGLNQDMCHSFPKSFTKIGINCKKLKIISLKIFTEFLFKFTEFFGSFTKLIELEFWGNRSVLYELQNTKSLKKLKRIRIHCHSIETQFFSNISIFAPNLTTLELNFRSNLTNDSLMSLSFLKHIQSISIEPFNKNQNTDDRAVVHLLDSCQQLRELSLRFITNITYRTIFKLIETANNRPKHILSFHCIVTEPQLTPKLLTESVPKNLLIKTEMPLISI